MPRPGGGTTGPGPSRRAFLGLGGLGTLGLTARGRLPVGIKAGERAVILLMLVGGPSQLETWDPKPEAPSAVRGPFGAIATSVPGVRIGAHLPGLARRMRRLTLLRSLHHDAAPIHETGLQLTQTGRLCRPGREHPHVGSVVARESGTSGGVAPFVILPGPIGDTGVDVPHGQSSGVLGPACAPFLADRARPSRATATALDLDSERDTLRDAYGRNPFGANCLRARRLVEAGSRVVTVNMFPTVFGRATWDCHGSRPFGTFDDYAREFLPTFDAAFSSLLDDLDARGLLDSTLVVATGEFGRTPRLNAQGGRDHWPGVWSAALAGGGTRGGRVLGASDAEGALPSDRPVTPAELVATMYHCLGIDPGRPLTLDDGRSITPVEGARPIAEAF